MREKRSLQPAYSELQDRMLDEESRLAKAAKIAAVVQHFLGRSSLEGLRLLDIGCSAGIVAHDLARRGAATIGIDIDVPGLAKAQASFGKEVAFLCADAERMPLASGEIDVVVFNQIYEHVVDPIPIAAEIGRVLAPGGVAYLGLANRLGVIEPHYKLPFLSWLPRPLAHRYIRATGKADRYHERFLTRPGLRRLFGDLDVWDYTFPVLAEPDRFEARDVVPPLVPPAARSGHASGRAAHPPVHLDRHQGPAATARGGGRCPAAPPRHAPRRLRRLTPGGRASRAPQATPGDLRGPRGAQPISGRDLSGLAPLKDAYNHAPDPGPPWSTFDRQCDPWW